MENEKSLVLLRGLPGSGKSRLAKLLSENGKYPVYAIDDYFENEQGQYTFDHRKNHLAYEACEQRTRKALHEGVEKIFIAHTFTLDWEMEPYLFLAKENGYSIYVITVENYHGNKNVHGIPEEQIMKMAEKYKVRLY